VTKFCAQLIVSVLIQKDDLGCRTNLSFDVVLFVDIIATGFIFKFID